MATLSSPTGQAQLGSILLSVSIHPAEHQGEGDWLNLEVESFIPNFCVFFSKGGSYYNEPLHMPLSLHPCPHAWPGETSREAGHRQGLPASSLSLSGESYQTVRERETCCSTPASLHFLRAPALGLSGTRESILTPGPRAALPLLAPSLQSCRGGFPILVLNYTNVRALLWLGAAC